MLLPILILKVKNDHRSKLFSLSNWKEEAWKNQGFNGIRTRDLRVAGALLYLAPNVWLHSSVGRATHWQRGGHGFESRWSPDFFRLLLSNCLNWKIYCDDHSSLSSTTAVQNELFHVLHIILILSRPRLNDHGSTRNKLGRVTFPKDFWDCH